MKAYPETLYDLTPTEALVISQIPADLRDSSDYRPAFEKAIRRVENLWPYNAPDRNPLQLELDLIQTRAQNDVVYLGYLLQMRRHWIVVRHTDGIFRDVEQPLNNP